MNGGQVFGFLVCLGGVLLTLLAFEVAVFRVACGLCRVPQPGVAATAGMVAVLLVVPAVVDGVFGAVLYEVYTAAGYPLWEAGVVQFFLALPAHMAICSAIHARMVGVRVGRALGVWLVEKLLKLVLLAAVVGVVVALVLVARANG